MQIKLQKIKLNNFKGIRSLEIPFTKTTSIYGDNAVGKTSVFDAFTWCLFGKDSSDRKDFEVKTLDGNNEVIPNIEHDVEVTMQVEQQVITLKRILREKWTKKRGSAESEFTGNETLYFWNDVPCQQKEYQEKVSSLVDEGLFKLITNPLYFNVNMKWQDRRLVLFSMADKVDDGHVFVSITNKNNENTVAEVMAVLNQGKSAEEYKKEISAKKKKLKDELALIPSRIDEVQRSKPETQDYETITKKGTELRAQLKEIEDKKESITKSQAASNQVILDKQRELNELKSQLQQLNFDLTNSNKAEINKIESQIKDLERQRDRASNSIDNANKEISLLNQRVAELESANANLRLKWNEVNETKFQMDADKTMCPSCKRKLEDADVHNIEEDLLKNFNKSKQKKLDEISQKGVEREEEIHEYKNAIDNCIKAIATNKALVDSTSFHIQLLQNSLSQLQNEKIVPGQDIIDLESKIASFVIPESAPSDFTELNSQKFNIESELQELLKLFATKEQIEKANVRINELQSQESTFSQQLADLESHEFVLEAFNKSKIDAMVLSVNSKFKHVKFKLFEKQINGGEAEICEVLVNTNGAWVPFSNGNTAGQINAGLDIINTLCSYHDVYAPIFIDNRESVNQLIDTQSQIVNLIVSNDKSLKIK